MKPLFYTVFGALFTGIAILQLTSSEKASMERATDEVHAKFDEIFANEPVKR